MAQVVLSGIPADAEIRPGALFRGLKFWLSQKVPQRSRFLNDIRANGGEILPIEKHADVKIVDHARKEAPPGTHSYTFIENSVKNGALEDLEHHRAGPPEGSVRGVGSIVHPAKGTRNKYTQEDDRILWSWVHDHPQKFGGTDGNEIYKQLETKHQQHPWQSWRDRWIKQLKGKPCPFPLPHNAPPTPPSEAPPVGNATIQSRKNLKLEVKAASIDDDYDSFDEDDVKALMSNGDSILNVHPENVAEAWETWARHYDVNHHHSAQGWQRFWENCVRPQYLDRLGKDGAADVVKNSKPTDMQDYPPTKRRKVTSKPMFSSSNEDEPSPNTKSNTPCYRPESPRIEPRAESPKLQSSPSTGNLDFVTPERTKRKRSVLEEELPSSSPLENVASPKRLRPNTSGPLREIASTPDKYPITSGNRADSPLLVGSEDDSENGEVDLDANVSSHEKALRKYPPITLPKSHYVLDTQDIFQAKTQQVDVDIAPPDEQSSEGDLYLRREPTQAIDFDVPPPNEGWDEEDTGAEASSESESIISESHERRGGRQGTQAIFREQTLVPDFNIVEPDGSWDEIVPSLPPPIPGSPFAESEISDVDAQTEAWINAHAIDGVSIDDVLLALKRTSMNTDLAELVLDSIGEGEGIPDNVGGVWTELDDEDLKSTDARKIQRLESKHGKDGYTSRWEFLSFYRTV